MLIKKPRDTNGSHEYEGRITVGALERHAQPVTSVTEKIAHGLTLLARRDAYLDGEHIGIAEQYQRSGIRNRNGHEGPGPGRPTEWRFIADDGREWHGYAHRSLAEALFVGVTLQQGGSV